MRVWLIVNAERPRRRPLRPLLLLLLLSLLLLLLLLLLLPPPPLLLATPARATSLASASPPRSPSALCASPPPTPLAPLLFLLGVFGGLPWYHAPNLTCLVPLLLAPKRRYVGLR
jgi:hypothetical protein